MQLYTHALSPYSAKVRIALAEKGIDYEEIQVPVGRHGIVSKPPELVAANPRDQVPTLLDDSLALYDSTVILEYLDERTPIRRCSRTVSPSAHERAGSKTMPTG